MSPGAQEATSLSGMQLTLYIAQATLHSAFPGGCTQQKDSAAPGSSANFGSNPAIP